MRKGKYSWIIMIIGALLLTAATVPVYAQSATDNTEDPDNFAEFIDCLFGGAGETADDNTAQNVVDAIEGTTQSVPTEQDIRDCFDPIYEPTGTAAGPATGPSTLEPTVPDSGDGADGADGSDGEG
jgi:hypothetical protein